MTKTISSKAGLALAAAAAISMCIPAYVEAAPQRYGRNHVHNAPRHHHSPPPRHNNHSRSGAGIGLVLGALAIGAIIAANAQASAPEVHAAPTYVAPPPAAPQFQQGYWYYCREANAYYPYVQQCPGPWQQVIPQPPAPGSY